MSLTGYQVFYTIVEEGSLAKAAEVLSISPSAVSHSLLSLEKECNFPLITRSRSGVALTGNGERVFRYIQTIMEQEQKLQEEINQINCLEKGLVRLGTLNSICTNWIPGILSSFLKKYPGIEVEIYQGGYSELETLLLNGKLDISFVTLPTSEYLATTTLMYDRLLCITPGDFKPKNADYVTIDDIRNENLLLFSHGYDKDLKTFVAKHNLKVQNQHHIINNGSIVALVESGLGFSIIPELVLKKISGNYNIYPLENEEYRTIAFATLKKQAISPATTKMIDEIKEYVENFLHDHA